MSPSYFSFYKTILGYPVPLVLLNVAERLGNKSDGLLNTVGIFLFFDCHFPCIKEGNSVKGRPLLVHGSNPIVALRHVVFNYSCGGRHPSSKLLASDRISYGPGRSPSNRSRLPSLADLYPSVFAAPSLSLSSLPPQILLIQASACWQVQT